MLESFERIERSFYEREPLRVTEELLGKYIVRETPNGKLVGKIVETEAYIGPYDKGSHAYNNKRTKRTEIQYGERGFAYIFTIYGKNVCFCVVIGRKYMPAVALIRAVEPVSGIELMKKNRETEDIKNLTNGPSKFCQAFGITKNDYGTDLCTSQNLYLVKGEAIKSSEIARSKRINIDYAEEWKDKEWRFYIKNNEFVSRF